MGLPRGQLTELTEEPLEPRFFGSPVATERHEYQRHVAPARFVESLVLRRVDRRLFREHPEHPFPQIAARLEGGLLRSAIDSD